MAESKYLCVSMVVFCIIAAGIAEDAVSIRMPRKNILSLQDLKNAGNTWYGMYVGDSFTETHYLYNTKYLLTWPDPESLIWSYTGQYFNSETCSSYNHPTANVSITDKAIFTDVYDSTFSFVSSDPSQYLLMFQCLIPDGRFCSSDQTAVIFLVKDQRPDSLPLMSALNDLKRNTDGVMSFDGSLSTGGGDPLKFFYTMIGDHICDN